MQYFDDITVKAKFYLNILYEGGTYRLESFEFKDDCYNDYPPETHVIARAVLFRYEKHPYMGE
jgi:hypothetical protein